MPTDYAALCSPFPRARASILPCLVAVQRADGYVSADALLAISAHTRTPRSEVYGVARSYSELCFTPPDAPHRVRVCTGLSCLLRGAKSLAADLAARSDAEWIAEDVTCRFRCPDAPIVAVDREYVVRATVDSIRAAMRGPQIVATHERSTLPSRPKEVRRLLARAGHVAPDSIADALEHRAYRGLAAARALPPEAVVENVADAALVGRGGAYFPVAAKWHAARRHPAPRYLVVNAEEGEPGVFKDRHLLELDPHLVVEGVLIAAHAIEPDKVFVYVNGEADPAADRLAGALGEARSHGLLEDAPPIEVRRGAGGYVCGEESVILSSIEGERAVPRLRPPFPVDAGLWGRPTVINNVETLSNLPSIFRDGVAEFRGVGTAEFPGTKLLCVSGAVRAPGVYEVPFGITLREVIDENAGGAHTGATLTAALCGGPSGGLLPSSRWDVPLLPGRLDEGGAVLGSGGIVVIDESMTVREVVRHLTAYNAAESCGKCTPCREGTARMVELIDRPVSNSVDRLDELAEAIATASLCGLGQMAPGPYRSARLHFSSEFGGEP